jgi:chromosome segregation ATPase
VERSSRRLLSLALAVPILLLGGVALGSKTGDARTRAEALLATLSGDPASAHLAHGSIEPARHALSRAEDARAAADYPHAAQLEELALEHAETGADLVKSAETEAKLAKAQKELSDLETKITRARALLEETVARRGRAQAKLDELDKKPAAPAPKEPKPAATPKTGGGK